jgi:hypothetical protein
MRWIAIPMLLLLLAACSPPVVTERPIVVQSQPINRPILSLPSVDRYTLTSVEWIIITPDNVDQMFDQMQSRGEAPALIAVTADGYENIAINTQEALRIILQQQAQLDGYRHYYIQTDTQIREHNLLLEQ